MPILPSGIVLPPGCTLEGAYTNSDKTGTQYAGNALQFFTQSGYYSVPVAIHLLGSGPNPPNTYSCTVSVIAGTGGSINTLYQWQTPEITTVAASTEVDWYFTVGNAGSYAGKNVVVSQLPPIAIPPGYQILFVANPFNNHFDINGSTFTMDLYPWTQTPEELDNNQALPSVIPAPLA